MKASRRGFLGAIIGGAVAPYVPAAPKPSILNDVLFIAASAGKGRRLVRTGLPTVTWRKFNEGIVPTPASAFRVIND